MLPCLLEVDGGATDQRQACKRERLGDASSGKWDGDRSMEDPSTPGLATDPLRRVCADLFDEASTSNSVLEWAAKAGRSMASVAPRPLPPLT
jgi:hypothetical protein